MPGKISLSPEQLQMIEKLFAVGFGTRQIAAELNISRWMVQKGCKQLRLETSSRKNPKKQIPQEQGCKICKEVKEISHFAPDKKHFSFKKKYCLKCLEKFGVKLCERSLRNNWNLAEINIHLDEKKNIKYQSSKKWRKEKIHSDPYFKLRNAVSNSVNCYLKKSLSSKNNQSTISFLPYSIDDLKNYLESQFESWMNWNNWGNYRRNSWNDNDPSTWTWQIDHIIPHSNFKYQSMTDSSFIDCWSLKNLRPLSSKKNILKGAKKIVII